MEGNIIIQLVVSNTDGRREWKPETPQRATGELLIMRNLYWVIAAAVLAVIVHISMVLFAPGFLFDRNLDRLASDVPDNTFFILPGEAQSKIFPDIPAEQFLGCAGSTSLGAGHPGCQSSRRDLDPDGLFQVWKDALHGHRRAVRRRQIQPATGHGAQRS